MTEFCIEDIYSDMSEAMEKIAADDNGAVLVNPGREADFPESLTSYLQAIPKGSCHSVFVWDNDNRHVLRLKLKGDHPSDNTDSTLDKKEINRDNEIPALPNAPMQAKMAKIRIPDLNLLLVLRVLFSNQEPILLRLIFKIFSFFKANMSM